MDYLDKPPTPVRSTPANFYGFQPASTPGADGLTLDHADKAMAWLGEPITPDDAEERCEFSIFTDSEGRFRQRLAS